MDSIKFSVTHSSILEKAGEIAHEVEHQEQISRMVRLLEGCGAKILETSRVNVTALLSKERFLNLFDLAEDAIEGFYGKIMCKNSVIGKFIDHLEHHDQSESHGS